MVLEGYLYGCSLSLVGVLAGAFLGPGWAIPEFLLAAFTMYFFRDPNRVIPDGESVVSPADGRVVELRETEVEGQRVWKIGIFLSIFDVHVNRSPVAGVISDVRYTPGKFLMAFRPEASVENEQNSVTVQGARFPVTFKQIAGVVARRIVFKKKVGDRVERGERVGLIKFGSRVDLYLPLDLVLEVSIGGRVQGGSSILAGLPESHTDVRPQQADVNCEAGAPR